MKIYIYESDNPKLYAANFFADAFLKYTGKEFASEQTRAQQYQNLPRFKNGKPKPLKITLVRAKSGKPKPLKTTVILHFSISHSGKYWGIAFSDRPVGLDFQTKLKQGKTRDFSATFLQKILSQGEALIKNNPLHNFVAKEAYAKLTGEGLSLGFSNISAAELIEQYHPYSLEDENIILYAFSKSPV